MPSTLAAGIRFVSLVAAACVASIAFAPLAAEDAPPGSPTMRRLSEDIASGARNAVGDFWKSLETSHTPIVEAIEGDPSNLWVTFVWRGAKDAHHVLLGGALDGPQQQRFLARVGETDVWFKTLRMRSDTRLTYLFGADVPLDAVPLANMKEHLRRSGLFKPDPFNPAKFGRGALLELKGAPKQTWIDTNDAAPKGKVDIEAGFASKILGNARDISVYTPAGYSSAGDYPTVYLFDRGAYTTLVPTPRILDNLIHARAIPPVVAVFIDNPQNLRMKELACDPDFTEFLADELVPWIRSNYFVSTDPARTIIGGSSLGGLGSSFAAFQHPEIFGNVLSQSGSYWWSADFDVSDPAPGVEGEWLTRQFVAAPVRPIRFYLEVGLYEGAEPSMAVVNRHFRDVLTAKGYSIVHYSEFSGAHEYLHWRGSIADGLIALLKP